MPAIIPTIQKSESENAVPDKFNVPITGITARANKEITIPCTNAPIRQPFRPPSAFAKTPALPPQKKCATTPGTIIGSRIFSCIILNPIRTNIVTMPPANDIKNPIIAAFGA